jgi:4-alpha-glucanotransferase
LLAAFLDHPACEPSPYSPASRSFWNEFYLDIMRIPEFACCRAAQTAVRSRSFQKELRAFRADDLIDYAAQWKLRRKVLELLAKDFFSRTSPRHADFERYLRERPEVEDYSAFRAVCDKFKISWREWPQPMRDGALHKTNFAEATKRFYLYIQWAAHEQVAQLVTRSESNGVKLYLDLPLGVNPDGYDVWRERENFALGATAGAPPDMFFTKGQDWGFAPLHPRRIRESGYRHLRAFLRFQMRHARLLRIDHVMGLHRLYWVPRGFEAGQGTYVNYPADELQAIFNLESHRNRTLLVGENLGTVPRFVNQSLRRYRVREMYVLQFEERPDPKAALRMPPKLSVTSLNTHDTPTFAAHWRGDDLRDCFRRGLLSRAELNKAARQRKRQLSALTQFLIRLQLLKKRSPRVQDVLEALLVWLQRSPSELILINLEDLWLETRPQNVPGTSIERPNWRRKARLTIEQMFADANVRKLLSQMRSGSGRVQCFSPHGMF